jgi:hypothetical protein
VPAAAGDGALMPPKLGPPQAPTLHQRFDEVAHQLDRIVAAVEVPTHHLPALDTKSDKTNLLLERIVDQLRHMNEEVIRAVSIRGELDGLRHRLDALERERGPAR